MRQIIVARSAHRHTRGEAAVLALLIAKPKGITGNYEIRNDSLNIVLVTVDSLHHIKSHCTPLCLRQAKVQGCTKPVFFLSAANGKQRPTNKIIFEVIC
jgi:hypothetical protein